MKKYVVFGATSAIAIEVQKIWAADAAEIVLCGRNLDKLSVVREDLLSRGAAKVELLSSDLCDITLHEKLLNDVYEILPEIDCALIAYGSLGVQEAAEQDRMVAEKELQINFNSVVSLLGGLANRFEQRKAGVLAVISSVAGDRGRQSNYVYGAAKGALSIFLGGLRNRLAQHGVHVLTIKPGFVDTPMTKDIKKGALWVGPEVVAHGIVKAIKKRQNVVCLPWFWRYIMLIIVNIPEFIFKKLKL